MVDGILILAIPEIRDLFDLKVFVDTEADLRILRRIRRDMTERGRTLDSVIEQYQTTVKPMHDEFVEPSKKYADIIIPEGGRNEKAMAMLLGGIKSLLT
jgi:uridine kinase